MSASEHLNPAQLRLFMQAKELMDTQTHEWQSERDMPPTTMRENLGLYIGKLRETQVGSEHDSFTSKKRGKKSMYQSIKEKGVESPVLLRYGPTTDQPTISDGHHRIAAANDINEDMYIPVRYASAGNDEFVEALKAAMSNLHL